MKCNLTYYVKHDINYSALKQVLMKKELRIMKQRRVILPTLEDAKDFVAAASKCDFDIDVFYNRIIIDAKSILGVLSLDLTRILTVEFNGSNAEFEAFLEKKEPSGMNAA